MSVVELFKLIEQMQQSELSNSRPKSAQIVSNLTVKQIVAKLDECNLDTVIETIPSTLSSVDDWINNATKFQQLKEAYVRFWRWITPIAGGYPHLNKMWKVGEKRLAAMANMLPEEVARQQIHSGVSRRDISLLKCLTVKKDNGSFILPEKLREDLIYIWYGRDVADLTMSDPTKFSTMLLWKILSIENFDDETKPFVKELFSRADIWHVANDLHLLTSTVLLWIIMFISKYQDGRYLDRIVELATDANYIRETKSFEDLNKDLAKMMAANFYNSCQSPAQLVKIFSHIMCEKEVCEILPYLCKRILPIGFEKDREWILALDNLEIVRKVPAICERIATEAAKVRNFRENSERLDFLMKMIMQKSREYQRNSDSDSDSDSDESEEDE